MKVTIGIPCYNAARWLRQAVQSALDQRGVEAQVIVVDDGSTDDSASIARDFGERVKVIQGTQTGANHARNLILQAATGDWVQYLDAGQWGQRVAAIESDFVLLGHTHFQDMRRFGRVTVVNPGSVGLNRDGSGKACYAVYDEQGMTLKRVDYDIDRTVAALRASPLPQSVVCKLEFTLRPQPQE